jgi:hypothetical protein
MNWQTDLCAANGLSSSQAVQCSVNIQKRFQTTEVFLLGPVSRHGLRATYLRESLRDIEACLRARPHKLYHLGIRGQV